MYFSAKVDITYGVLNQIENGFKLIFSLRTMPECDI